MENKTMNSSDITQKEKETHEKKQLDKDNFSFSSLSELSKSTISTLESFKKKLEIRSHNNEILEDDCDIIIGEILNFSVSGVFDEEKKNVIKDPFHVLVILELISQLPVNGQLRTVTLLQKLARKNIKNLQVFTKVGLIQKLLKRISTFKRDDIADKAIDLVGDLATYSITVRELKCFFSSLQRTEDMCWPSHSLKLLEILKKMPEKPGPDVYFNFTGKQGATITIPPIAKWPHQSGFTFMTWFQLDAAHLSQQEQNSRPHLYCFVNNRGLGYLAHFSGPMFVIEVWGKNGRKQTILVKSKFEPLMWYHVCVSHTYNRFKSSEVKVFVNGQMVTSGDITMPVNKDPMDKCFIGGSHLNSELYMFKGQMAAIYVVAEAVTQNTVVALYRLGPGYKGKFKFKNELESNMADNDKKLIYDGRLSQNLLFTYNPKAVDGELCIESSPIENQACFYHSPHALMMEGVQAIVTHSLQGAMHSLGGIQMLFPLFAQLDCPIEGQTQPEPKICSMLLSLIYDLLRGSSACQQQLVQCQGFMVIGHLLQKSSPVHLTEATVDTLLGLARYFMATPSAQSLLGGLLDHILLEPSIWIKTPLSLQCNLLSLFATGYVGCLDYAGYIRREVGVPRLILMLRKYYSLELSQHNQPTSKEEIISLRAFVLLLIKQMIIKDEGIYEDELKSVLVYLAVEEHEENYKDVMQMILATMCELPQAIIPYFDKMEGFHVFFKVLVANDEEIRIHAIKIISAYMQQLSIRRKLELVEKYSIVTKVGQKLTIFELTMATYNALFEFLTARTSKIVTVKRHNQPDDSFVMYHPTVLPIIVNLILNGRNSENEESIKLNNELSVTFLSDLTLLLTSNDDNKRLMLQLMCWQHWLFSLAYLEPKTKEEAKITDTVYSVVKILLYYAIQHEKDGWRVWVDTLAILHGKIAELFEVDTKCEPFVIPQTKYRDQETGEMIQRESNIPTNSMKHEVIDPKTASNVEKYAVNQNGIKSDTISQGKEESISNSNHESTDEKVDTKDVNKNGIEEEPKDVSPEKELNNLHINENENKSLENNNLPTDSSPVVNSPESEKSPSIENDIRKQFFEKLLLNQSNLSVITDKNSSRKYQSTNDLLDDENDFENGLNTDEGRPRSASPTIYYNRDRNENVETSVEDEIKNKKNEIEKKDVEENIKLDEKSASPPSDSVPPKPVELEHNESLDTQEPSSSVELPVSPGKSKTKPYVDIPVFSWSNPHQRLLTELLYSIEKDLQVWKSHNRKTVADFVSSRENSIYIMNLCHMVSLLSDSLIFCCGGLLPLLSSATSQDFSNDVLEACGGMTLDTGFSFLNRLMNVIDIIAYSSSNNFASVETHRNISVGGVLRQCIRLVFCGAARNRVVCRQRERPSSVGHIHPKSLKETKEAIKTLIASTKPPTDNDLVQNIPGHMTTITNAESLLQDNDINRLRALVYREVEDSKQSQYVALVVIYFVAVLMVARYRDLLDHDQDQRSRGSSNADSVDENVNEAEKQGESIPKMSIDQKIEILFDSSANLLREILFDFSSYLSRILVGSRGQDLITEGLSTLKSEESTIELVMLLCSQEWQNTLQRHAGAAFMDLVDEGRLLSHSTRERIVITSSEARDIMNEKDNYQNLKHAQFETICTQTMIQYIEQYKTYDQFFRAKKKRNAISATNLLEKVFDVLTSDFGAWPSSYETHQKRYKYYKLDRWEDSLRRRVRFVKNQFGTSHLDATLRPGSAEVIPPDKPLPLKYHLFAQKLPSNELLDTESDSEDESLAETNITEDIQQHSGSIVFTAECTLVLPGTVLNGVIAITTDSLYFTADEEYTETKKSNEIISYNDCLNIKCSFVNIVGVISRRYILQNKAVEVFLANRRSFLFSFSTNQVSRQVIEHLPPVGIGANYGLPRTRAVSQFSPKQIFKKSNILQRWQNREISNFEYLMALNTIAGRTYNDLNQYFIFPWVLKDYESSQMDVSDPNNYRDLSKPIGALNPFRLAQFIERFNTWDDSTDIPPFHYGTHYSTGGFVLNWLVRVEPFASLFLSLQGGKFDHPLRTFSSIKRAWDNCQNDTSDVKELIPELYYLPDMFTNDNNFVWGEGEDGKNINDVILPNWAASPEAFIKIHREALESQYVSDNLHKWIDLIFGYKQKGKDAEYSANVFYHLTYEGSVDLDNITDKVTKEALIEQIKSFGQTPCQLLNAAHPPRDLVKDTNVEPHKSIYLSFSVTPEVPVTHVTAYTSPNVSQPAIITISCNQVFTVNKWINYGGDIKSYQSLKHVQIEQDPSIETHQGLARRQLGEPLDENVTITSSCFVVTSDNKFILTCGYWDKSFKCFSTESGKLNQCIYGHWNVVTCLAYSDDMVTGSNAIIVSGSADATVLVWIWDHKSCRIIGPNDASNHGSTPIAICTGHELPISCVDVNSSLGIIASGSLEGSCLLHSISGDLLYSLKGPKDCLHPRLINISNERNILVNYADKDGFMVMFSNNGKLLSHVQLTDQNLAVVFTNDGCFFVAGGFSRCFQIWRSYDLVLMCVVPPCDGSIRSLALTPDQKCLVAGLSTGSIIAMAMDFSMWPRLNSPQKSSKSPKVDKNSEEQKSVDSSDKSKVKKEKTTTAIIEKVPDDDAESPNCANDGESGVVKEAVLDGSDTKTLLAKSQEVEQLTNETEKISQETKLSNETNNDSIVHNNTETSSEEQTNVNSNDDTTKPGDPKDESP